MQQAAGERKSPIIHVDNVSLAYLLGGARVPVLRGVQLQIAAGERVAVAGPSGCGKSSLLLLLAGLERPEQGRILVDGVDLAELGSDGLADWRCQHLGIVFQSFHLLPSLTALDNVALPLKMAGRRDAAAEAAAMLARVGLAARAGHRPSQLSGGEQQRVAIARALVHRPRLVLADEPTGNLDAQSAEAVRTLLFELNRELGSTLVLVTHDLDFAARCDRVLRLQEGQLHPQSSPAHRPVHPADAASAHAFPA